MGIENIYSVSFENLNDEEKDELFTTITWFDCGKETLNMKKLMKLFYLSQETLKYKGEQVEVLLHKLDEVAEQQGEEEIQKLESDTDGRSSKSKKSNSIEFENLEQKYEVLKNKYKKQAKINEKSSNEIEKLKNKVSILEEEKIHLLKEIEVLNQDSNQSDSSGNTREHNRELVNTLHKKNKQISELLHDIEDVEKENSTLRDKLSCVRDELATATKGISDLTESLEASEIKLKETFDIMENLKVKNESLQEDLQESLNQKVELENQVESFKKEINSKVEEWKSLFEKKEKELREIKANQLKLSSQSSPNLTYHRVEYEDSQLTILNRVLSERENEIIHLKTQLENATKEMEESTLLINDIKKDHKENVSRIDSLNTSIKDLKRQLRTAHERCRKLQESIANSEEIIVIKDKNLQEILQKIKENGYEQLSDSLHKLSKLKETNYSQEKHIITLVRNANNIQEECEDLKRENEILRGKTDISLDISVGEIPKSTRKKDINDLKKRLKQMEEGKLELHTQNQRLNRIISLLSLQLIELGQSPAIDELDNRDSNKIIEKPNIEVGEKPSREIYRESSIEFKKISETTVSELQNEIRTLQQINTELKQQIENVKMNAQLPSVELNYPLKSYYTDVKTLNDITQNLQQLKTKMGQDIRNHIQLNDKLKYYETQLHVIKQQVMCLYNDYSRNMPSTKEKSDGNQLMNQNETGEMPESILHDDDQSNAGTCEISNRKCIYLESEIGRISHENMRLKKDMHEAEIVCTKKLSELSERNKSLQTNIEILSNKLNHYIEPEQYGKNEEKLENLIVKHRELLHNFNEMNEREKIGMQILEKSIKLVQDEKRELKNKIIELLENQYKTQFSNEDNVETISKKLAQCEVNEMSERQRANHTNNLYELVKEQLQKSEARFEEFEKCNKEILKKNVLLQQQIRAAEEKLTRYISDTNFGHEQANYNELLLENEKLVINLDRLKTELEISKKTTVYTNNWNTDKEQELLDLKHQLVDLISDSDGKMQLARINNDLAFSKSQENCLRSEMGYIKDELDKYRSENEEYSKKLNKALKVNQQKESELQSLRSTIAEILDNHKIQFLGCIPLSVEEQFIDDIKDNSRKKYEIYQIMYEAYSERDEVQALKQFYEDELSKLKEIIKCIDNEDSKRMSTYCDKSLIRLNEIKFKRQLKLKELQLAHVQEKVKMQDEQLIKLEEELLNLHKSYNLFTHESTEIIEQKENKPINSRKNKETQTEKLKRVSSDEKNGDLRCALTNAKEQIKKCEENVEKTKNRVVELESEKNLLRKQLSDKHSQITFYEKHIMELKNSKMETVLNDELSTLKSNIKHLQDNLKEKEDIISNYQSLLKTDRDKHSMAARLMQEELKILQKCLLDEKQKFSNLQSSMNESHPSKAALEQYFIQVHGLEEELTKLRTTISCLDSQLKASRQEAVRWRSLANDRLETMEKLGKELEDSHQSEIIVYRNEITRLKEENSNYKQELAKYKNEKGSDYDMQKLLKEKDEKIHELYIKMRQNRKVVERSDNDNIGSKVGELEFEKEQLIKENDTLRKRYEQLLNKEKQTRDEIRELRGKLLKRPLSSARSDRSDKSIKEQLQKKIAALENDNFELKENLERQISINEAHRVKVSEDFDKWNKQKYWQQNAEKLKMKLKEKESDFDKIQQTCTGYRSLIERLEREKQNLENKIATLKNTHKLDEEIESLKLENKKLQSDIDVLNSKLEMQQHHSGGLGAVMLEEKLEAQERKIAVLELSTKSSPEIREELERLQSLVSNLQKSNLRLEAENLEVKLDLEKCNKGTPHLRDQIRHLENYIEVLKSEKQQQPEETENLPKNPDSSKKVSELERTVFVLKRVVEKLQAENKRLLNSKRPCQERSNSNDKLGREFCRLKEQYTESIKKVSQLEQELCAANSKVKMYENSPVKESTLVTEELAQVKEQLQQKTNLLDKVKALLHRAAVKEKALLEEIAELRGEALPSKDGDP